MGYFLSITLTATSTITQDDGLQARYVPVSQLPTTPLQQTAIAIIFLMTVLSVLIWGTRMYYRFRKKQIGLGKFPTTLHFCPSFLLTVLDDGLVTIATVRTIVPRHVCLLTKLFSYSLSASSSQTITVSHYSRHYNANG